MGAFNFGGIANVTGVAKVQRRLKPWDIYKVKFDGARIDEVKGTKDPEAVYRILKVRFVNDEGYYEESIFFPKEDDDVRPTSKIKNKDGKEVEIERPSSLENTEMFIAQVAAVLNPDMFKKLQQFAVEGKLKDFETVAKFFVEKICKPVIGKETNLKLIGKKDKEGNYQPRLPYFTNINKQGELYLADNFLGDKLFFSDYEETQRKQYLSAKPTDMKEKTPEVDTNEVISENAPELNQDTKDELDSMLDELD